MDPSKIVRPKPSDTEDDLLEMQQEWISRRGMQEERPTVEVHRVKRKSDVDSKTDQSSKIQGVGRKGVDRFTIDLDDIKEEWSTPQVLFDVQEMNEEYLNGSSTNVLEECRENRLQYSKDDGFPNVLNLSEYFSIRAAHIARPQNMTSPKQKVVGNLCRRKASLLQNSTEFKEIYQICLCFHHSISEIVDMPSTSTSADTNESVEDENARYISRLPVEKIIEMQAEIKERLDPKTIEFLMNHKKRSGGEDETAEKKPKLSRFKREQAAMRDSENFGATLDPKQTIESGIEKEEKPKISVTTEEDIVKQLEVLDDYTSRTDDEKYNRLAADAIQVDFASKMLRNVAPRQQQNLLKLFDNLKSPSKSGKDDALTSLARSSIDEIKRLYLEEIQDGSVSYMNFERGVHPLTEPSWFLVPIRRVIDAVHKRQEDASADDLDLVRLSLLWTILLWEQRPTVFLCFAQPNDVIVRLTETYLLGNSVLADDVIVEGLARLINTYCLPAALEGRLKLRMSENIAGLDAFMPFWDDLLARFEESSFGDVGFSRALLILAYLNSSLTDSLECRVSLWSPKRFVHRQITLDNENAADILKVIREHRLEDVGVLDMQHYVAYCTLLGSYASAIRDKKVTRDRNPLMYTIASEELGEFVRRHTEQKTCNDERSKEMTVVVQAIRTAVADEIAF